MNCIDQVVTDTYTVIHGDCVVAIKGLPVHSIGFFYLSFPLYLHS